MARPRQPINILEAKGKKHLTKEEINERKKNEIKAPDDDIQPPKYLSAKEKREFIKIANELIKLDIMGNLDCDSLARYIQSESKYLFYDKLVNAHIAQMKKDIKELGISAVNVDTLKASEDLRDKALKQCRNSASDLGLTISSRCKLVIPKKEEPKKSKWDSYRSGMSG